jgi:hypothetical protein
MTEKSKHDGWTPQEQVQEQVQEQDPEDSAEFQTSLAEHVKGEIEDRANEEME